ncbi:hypothetical protein CKO25_08805 [Thiocapsa imhoffii]|uniref:Uncharacterized protein n=1 Tax=Thiocapsa imhoffii TaxID=382777 RepID=A0A9X0WHP3_9GAMM|nr:hypothetical protein [Thiocapsa imhoffii]MBK1644745.1 hypothetical protein [Thiocapsa imhoffii]
MAKDDTKDDDQASGSGADQPKRQGLGWVPKLSILAVVVAFGYLYYDTSKTDSTTAEMSSPDTSLSGTEATTGIVPQQVVEKLSELSASAGVLLSDATSASVDFFHDTVDKVKSMTGIGDDPTVASPAPEAVALDLETVESGVDPVTASAAAPVPAMPVAEVVEETAEVVAEVAPVSPPAPSADRPLASGFERHFAPLPAPPVRSTSQPSPSPASSDPVQAADAAGSAAAESSVDAEAAVFAESLMREQAPATVAPAAGDAQGEVPAESVMPAPTMAAPAAAPATPADPGPMAPAGVQPMPPVAPPAYDVSGVERQREAVAQYHARMRAEYENRRRFAEQQARDYWARMQQSAPVGMPAPMIPPGYGPLYGAPGYGPMYGAPAYPR